MLVLFTILMWSLEYLGYTTGLALDFIRRPRLRPSSSLGLAELPGSACAVQWERQSLPSELGGRQVPGTQRMPSRAPEHSK